MRKPTRRYHSPAMVLSVACLGWMIILLRIALLVFAVILLVQLGTDPVRPIWKLVTALVAFFLFWFLGSRKSRS